MAFPLVWTGSSQKESWGFVLIAFGSAEFPNLRERKREREEILYTIR